jgi:hypothetical protein
MAKQRPVPRTTKKHRARAERERIQRNWILGGTIITALVVIAVIVRCHRLRSCLYPGPPPQRANRHCGW